MVDNNSKVNTTNLYETVTGNVVRTVEEVARIQPQISQSIVSLQSEYILAAKNAIQTAFAAQKQFATSWNIPFTAQYAEQFAKQSDEITNNLIRIAGIGNQLTINAVDAAKEHVKAYTRTVDAVTEFNSNVAKAWNSYFSAQQQTFSRQ